MSDPCEVQTYINLQGGLNFEDYGVPKHTQDSIRRYIEHRYMPGGFVTSALALDIQEAWDRADHWNKPYVDEIVRWIKENLPEECYGSYDKVYDWISKR